MKNQGSQHVVVLLGKNFALQKITYALNRPSGWLLNQKPMDQESKFSRVLL